jgi:hypothetical protein
MFQKISKTGPKIIAQKSGKKCPKSGPKFISPKMLLNLYVQVLLATFLIKIRKLQKNIQN